jgi:hypothetical protein
MKRTEGYWFFEVLPYQDLFDASTANRIVVHGGNRASKTMHVVRRGLRIMSGEDPYNISRGWEPPIYLRFCGTGMTEQVQKVLVEWFRKLTPRSWLPNGEFKFNVQSGILRFDEDGPCKGGWAEFMSYDQDPNKGSGRPLHGVVFDEAYNCSMNFRQQCLSRLIDYGGFAWAVETPEEGDATWSVDWVGKSSLRTVYNEDTNSIRTVEDNEKDRAYNTFVYPTRLNRFLYKDNDISKGSEAIEQIIKDCEDTPNPEVERRIRLNGEFIASSNLIYSILDAGIHWIGAKKFGVDNSWTNYLAVDPGINKDHALMWYKVGPGRRFFFYRELYVSGPMDEMFKAALKAMEPGERIAAVNFDCHWDHDNRTATTKDGQRPVNLKRDLEDAMRESGWSHIDLIESENRPVESGFDVVRIMLRPNQVTQEPDMVFSRECVRLWEEMKKYRYVRERTKYPVRHKPKPRKIDDDGPDCVRIAVTTPSEYLGGRRPPLVESHVERDEYDFGF